MRFGVCAGPERAREILAAGFDYVEVGAIGFQGRNESWDPAPYQGIPVAATNLFFPGDMPLYSSDWRDYAGRTIERGVSLGVETMVVGSGGARRSTLEVPVEEAEERFLDVVAACQEMAGDALFLAPESLHRGETDVWNDSERIAHGLADRGLAFTADSYHILREWEAEGRPDLEGWMRMQVPFRPWHVHLSDIRRLPPDPADPQMGAFVARLAELGYERTVSLECPVEDLAVARRSLDRLFSS